MYQTYTSFYCDCNKMLFSLQDNIDSFRNDWHLYVKQSLAYSTTIVVDYNVRCIKCNKSLGSSKCNPQLYRFNLKNLKYSQIELNIDHFYRKM